LKRLDIKREVGCELVSNFGKFFNLVAGQPQRIDKVSHTHISEAEKRVSFANCELSEKQLP